MIEYENHSASAKSNLIYSNQNNKTPNTFALSLRAFLSFISFRKGSLS